jgi:hypothetical protein
MPTKFAGTVAAVVFMTLGLAMVFGGSELAKSPDPILGDEIGRRPPAGLSANVFFRLVGTSSSWGGVEAVAPIITRANTLGVSAGVIFGFLGAVLVYLGNRDAENSIAVFGAHLSTSSVGVVCIFVGASTAIATLWRTFWSLDKAVAVYRVPVMSAADMSALRA